MARLSPTRPDVEQVRRQAKDLLSAARRADPAARERIRTVSDREGLAAAQLAVAREYGFASWTRLKQEVERRAVLNGRGVESEVPMTRSAGSGIRPQSCETVAVSTVAQLRSVLFLTFPA